MYVSTAIFRQETPPSMQKAALFKAKWHQKRQKRSYKETRLAENAGLQECRMETQQGSVSDTINSQYSRLCLCRYAKGLHGSLQMYYLADAFVVLRHG